MSSLPSQTTPSREATLADAILSGVAVAGGILTAIILTGQWQPLSMSMGSVLAQISRGLGAAPAADSHVYWYMSRSAGIVAYLLLWGSVAWGLMVSNKILDGVVKPVLTYELHQFVSILALAVGAFHAFILLGDTYTQFGLLDLLLPFRSAYQPFWVGVCILALYLIAIITVSFYIKKRLGHRTWRVLHYASFGAWIMVTLHSVVIGSETASPVMTIVYLSAILSVSFLLTYRILMSKWFGRVPVTR